MQFRELTDRYQLEKILKSNRFGTVLRAVDSKSGRPVVVKLITVSSPPRLVAAAPEFARLAAGLSGLAAPSLPAVFDDGFTTDGSAFLVMEPLEGKGLDTLGTASPTRTLARMGQALDALEALAARGLAHLNLSPDNLLVMAEDETGVTGGGEQVKVLGLGTAVFRPLGAEAAAASPGENSRFQAPELAAGGAVPPDGRADVYSLAVITCLGLGATVGFGDSPVVQLPLGVSFELENDEALRVALERSLRRRPEERPSLAEFREALRLATGAPSVATTTAALPRPAAVRETPAPPPVPILPSPPPFMAPPAPPAVTPTVSAPPFEAPAAWSPATAPPPGPALSTAAPALAPPEALAGLPPLPDLPPLPSLPSLQTPPSAPEASPQPPETGGDQLSAVDDEILNALLNVPDPPRRPIGPAPKGGAKVVPFQKKTGPQPIQTAGAAAAAAGGAGAAATQSGRHPLPARGGGPSPLGPLGMLRKPAVLGAVAGAVVLAGLAGFWLLRRSHAEAVVVQAPSGEALPQPFSRPPVEKLAEAKLLLAEGKDLEAHRVLRSIPWGEQGLLSPEGCRTLAAIQQNLALAALERLPADLASGLKTGDLEVLETAVEAGAGQGAALAPDVRASYDKAKGILDAYAQARATAAGSDPVLALERFAALASLLPRVTDPDDLRGHAAGEIEKEAEGLVREGKYAEAVTRIAPVERTWPERTGIKERAARYQRYQQDEQRQEELLATLPALERYRKPWEGLQKLNGVEPTPHLAPRFAEARARLEEQLARLDKQPPQLVLRDGFDLAYDRGTVVNLSFRATDDYEVKEVKLYARPEGGKYRDMPLEKTRTGYYTVAVPPAFHQNGTVDFYVVATDLSGHESDLGSRDKPMQLKRTQSFRQLIR
jgi:serine/threonine protein kinase